MSVDNLRTGAAGQLGIATNALHDKRTIVTPDTFLPFLSESVQRDLPVVRKQSISSGIGPLLSDVRTIPSQRSTGDIVHALLNKGYARYLRHALYGYAFSWPGSTNGSATMTFNAAAANDDTITIEGQTYTFKTTLTASTTANEILVASSAILQASYFAAAVNRGVASNGLGSGAVYGSLTPQNSDVIATDNGDGTVTVVDRQARGAAVNSGGASEVATTETMTDASSVWSSATLVSGANGTDTARLHTYTLDPSVMFELMATLQIVRPPSNSTREAFTYVGKIVSSVFSFAENDALEFSATWDNLKESRATAIATPTYPSAANWFDYTQVIVELDDTSEPVQGGSVSIATGQEPRMQSGTTELRDHLITGDATITGELTREFENADIYDAWVAGDDVKIEMIATGGTIPSSASTYQLAITLPACRYTGSTPNIGGTGVVQNNIPFEAFRNGVDEWITVTYRTDEGYVGDNG